MYPRSVHQLTSSQAQSSAMGTTVMANTTWTNQGRRAIMANNACGGLSVLNLGFFNVNRYAEDLGLVDGYGVETGAREG